ncbi:hypothetical protein SAMN04487886_101135 [Clostridium sp. DSM 8431]|uniref:hypothetical protein n=1 Tax=Clostridium sp. DSM 8431 TaxID=1761781 RepID=UPI0008DEEE17|nr:hypothetical protein [Clostridium sp. DSM 8431]SFU35635.1 hypothetical protein SAMN04487886_101135 [Clostridium sp. DSM 8431]
MINKYDFMFKYLHNATKEERHIDEMNNFAKQHPILFTKCHFLFRPIVNFDENSNEYKEAREKLEEIFNKNEEDFKELFDVIREKFSGKYF